MKEIYKPFCQKVILGLSLYYILCSLILKEFIRVPRFQTVCGCLWKYLTEWDRRARCRLYEVCTIRSYLWLQVTGCRQFSYSIACPCFSYIRFRLWVFKCRPCWNTYDTALYTNRGFLGQALPHPLALLSHLKRWYRREAHTPCCHIRWTSQTLSHISVWLRSCNLHADSYISILRLRSLRLFSSLGRRRLSSKNSANWVSFPHQFLNETCFRACRYELLWLILRFRSWHGVLTHPYMIENDQFLPAYCSYNYAETGVASMVQSSDLICTPSASWLKYWSHHKHYAYRHFSTSCHWTSASSSPTSARVPSQMERTACPWFGASKSIVTTIVRTNRPFNNNK